MLPIGEYTTTRDPRPGPGGPRAPSAALAARRRRPGPSPHGGIYGGRGGGDNAVVVLSCTNVWERWAGMQK